MNRFDGKTVLITGGARGQGASHVRGFAREQARVVVADVREERGRALAEELGASAIFIKLDVSVPADWTAAVEETERHFGPISILINDAGILAPAVSIADSDPADWDQVIATNLTGPYLGIRAVVPSLRRAGGGAIINIASTSGHVGTPMLAPYVSSKWGLRGLTQTAATELARDRIRVNSISPGVINTPLITEPLRPGEVPVSDHFSPDPFAVPRMGEPEEVTKLLLFLASDDATFVTGSDYIIDGGMLLGPVPEAGQ
jgi:3alpha(or 20beta)-hydroxysteroid dehydrogenase